MPGRFHSRRGYTFSITEQYESKYSYLLEVWNCTDKRAVNNEDWNFKNYVEKQIVVQKDPNILYTDWEFWSSNAVLTCHMPSSKVVTVVL